MSPLRGRPRARLFDLPPDVAQDNLDRETGRPLRVPDPDPLDVQPLDVDLPTTFDDHGSGPPVLGGVLVAAAIVVMAVVLVLVAVRP